jgi:rhodanese-related sulfurtransferase
MTGVHEVEGGNMTAPVRVLSSLLIICGLSAGATSVASSTSVAQSTGDAVGLSQASMRGAAIVAPAPIYPRLSLERKSAGVAVASVVFGADGRTRTVTILEAPDTEIAEAVRAALMGWTWRPLERMGRAERSGGSGKLTFYFRVTDGRGQVVDPEIPAPPPAGTSRGRGAAPPAARAGTPGVPALEIPHAELKTLIARASPVLLDVGEREAFKRGHLAGAINIPVDELTVRARMELDPKKPHVIDCTQEERPRCDRAVATLRRAGFADLSLLVR